MGKIHQGILGNLTGAVGPVTGYIRNGQNILRTSTSNVKYKHTPLRAVQLEKIKICNSFTRAFSGKGFFSKTFPAHGNNGSGYNRATSALMSLALTGIYPDMHLNYQQVLVSKGRLPAAQNAKAVKKGSNTVQFNFTDNSTDGMAAPDDTVILVAYSPELQEAVFTLHGGFRKDKKAVLNVTALQGYTIETWIGFLSKDEQDASDSVWTGRMMM